MIGYFNLHIIWLKLLIPWRFFRLWALVDGVDPPENMLRCMSNNFSALAFWRAWHRSFNRWIVRYIYIPIGGAQRPIINMVAVFTFVAFWHDLSFKLLAWGWLVVLFVVPEILARKVFSPKKFVGREVLYRNLCALGGVANILMMMSANLVGFAIGVDGLKDMMKGEPPLLIPSDRRPLTEFLRQICSRVSTASASSSSRSWRSTWLCISCLSSVRRRRGKVWC